LSDSVYHMLIGGNACLRRPQGQLWAMGVFPGNDQIYLCFAKLTRNLMDHLESPLFTVIDEVN